MIYFIQHFTSKVISFGLVHVENENSGKYMRLREEFMVSMCGAMRGGWVARGDMFMFMAARRHGGRKKRKNIAENQWISPSFGGWRDLWNFKKEEKSSISWRREASGNLKSRFAFSRFFLLRFAKLSHSGRAENVMTFYGMKSLCVSSSSTFRKERKEKKIH